MKKNTELQNELKERNPDFSCSRDHWYYDLWWTIQVWYEKPWNWGRAIKWFFWRGKRGFSDRDVWSIDGYLNSWMPEAIQQLRETTHGYPGFDEAKTPKQWDKILKEIKEGFEAKLKLGNHEFTNKTLPKLRKQADLGMELFVKWYDHLWD